MSDFLLDSKSTPTTKTMISIKATIICLPLLFVVCVVFLCPHLTGGGSLVQESLKAVVNTPKLDLGASCQEATGSLDVEDDTTRIMDGLQDYLVDTLTPAMSSIVKAAVTSTKAQLLDRRAPTTTALDQDDTITFDKASSTIDGSNAHHMSHDERRQQGSTGWFESWNFRQMIEDVLNYVALIVISMLVVAISVLVICALLLNLLERLRRKFSQQHSKTFDTRVDGAVRSNVMDGFDDASESTPINVSTGRHKVVDNVHVKQPPKAKAKAPAKQGTTKVRRGVRITFTKGPYSGDEINFTTNGMKTVVLARNPRPKSTAHVFCLANDTTITDAMHVRLDLVKKKSYEHLKVSGKFSASGVVKLNKDPIAAESENKVFKGDVIVIGASQLKVSTCA